MFAYSVGIYYDPFFILVISADGFASGRFLAAAGLA
jgi:hypothetical protein